MPNAVFKLYAEYCKERDSESCDNAKLAEFQKKLFEAVTEENINDIDDEGYPLINLAAMEDETAIVLFLLSKNAKVNIPDLNQKVPMHYVVFRCNETLIKAFQKIGEDIDIRSSDFTALYNHVSTGKVNKVKILLEHGANVFAVCASRSILDATKMLSTDTTIDEADRNEIIKLLFKYDIGLYAKLDDLVLSEGLLDNALLMGATFDGKLISDNNLDFRNAICSWSKFFTAEKAGALGLQDYQRLIRSLKNLFKDLPISAAHDLEEVVKRMTLKFCPNSPVLLSPELALYLSHDLAQSTIRNEPSTNIIPDEKRVELEQLYKFLDEKLASTANLGDLIARKLLAKQGLYAAPGKPVDSVKLDAPELKVLPGDLIDKLQELADVIEKELGHRRTTNKIPHK